MWCANHDNQNLTSGPCGHGISRLPIHVQRTKVGWMSLLPFRKLAMYYLEHPRASWICVLQSKEQRVRNQISWKKSYTKNTNCLQRVRGGDEFLQANQVLAPRFRLFGSFLPDKKNAGGSAIYIYKDLLPEEAIVQHAVTCLCRDHLVNIRSGRLNLYCQRPFRAWTFLASCTWQITSHSPALACFSQWWALFWVTSTSVIQKKDDLMFGTTHSPMATRESLLDSIISFHMSLRLLNLITRGRTSQPLGSYALIQRLIVLWINLPMAEARDYHCYSHVFQDLVKRTITSDRSLTSTSCHSKAFKSKATRQAHSKLHPTIPFLFQIAAASETASRWPPYFLPIRCEGVGFVCRPRLLVGGIQCYYVSSWKLMGSKSCCR